MRRLMTAFFCASLCLGLGSLRAAGAQDKLVLKDGRVLRGQVVEEGKDSITLQVNGKERRFKRDLVAKLVYGSGADAAAVDDGGPPPSEGSAPSAVPVPASVQPTNGLVADLSRRYQVPASEVLWVRRQGIADADLPIVFFVAASAAVTPGPVVRLRLNGLSWREIENHYGLHRARVYDEPSPWVPYPTWGVGLGWGWGWHGDGDGDGWRGRGWEGGGRWGCYRR